MIKWLLNLYKEWKEKRYKDRIIMLYLRKELITRNSLPGDILTKISYHIEKLEKFKFKKQYYKYYKLFSYSTSEKVNCGDFYYGYRESFYPDIVLIYTRKGTKEILTVPESFLLTEKELHQHKFNSKMDKIIK